MPVVLPNGTMWLTCSDLARAGGVSRQWIWKLIRHSRIRATYLVPLGQFLIEPADGQEWLWASGRVPRGQLVMWA